MVIPHVSVGVPASGLLPAPDWPLCESRDGVQPPHKCLLSDVSLVAWHLEQGGYGINSADCWNESWAPVPPAYPEIKAQRDEGTDLGFIEPVCDEEGSEFKSVSEPMLLLFYQEAL